MKHGIFAVVVLIGAMVATSEARSRLALVEMEGGAYSLDLPVYALGQNERGAEVALVKATADELDASGRAYRVLDEDAEEASYLLAYEFRKGARDAARRQFNVVHEEGRRLVIRSASAGDVEALGNLGFQCRWLPSAPLDFSLAKKRGYVVPRMASVTSNATVSALIAQVVQTNLYVDLSELTGVVPVMADGIFTNIATRHQNSGTPLRRATALAYERFESAGLRAGYQAWTNGLYTGRNVVGTKPGSGAVSSEIVVVCAHIDDMPSGGVAPGADDNASGSVAVMVAGEILKNYRFKRTIRFVLFTGEEQGLLGSERYAQAAHSAGDNIVGALNLDMLGWDGNSDKVLNLYVRPASNPGHTGDRAIAATFTNVVKTYGLESSISPAIIAENVEWSDHASFWDQGYSAVCGIEEDVVDFNPYYHTTNDTFEQINLPYYEGWVKAVVGTVAHLAEPLSWDDGYVDLGGGWRRLAWFGDYAMMPEAGWIWHNKHGFFFVPSNAEPEDIWMYATDMGWLWTSRTVYPFLCRADPAAWLWYNGATNPRWFFNFSSTDWEWRP